MDLALQFSCAYPLIKQRFRRVKSANHLHVRGIPSSFEQRLSRTINGDRRIRLLEKASSSSSMGRSKKRSVCCKKPSDRRSSNPSKSNQEEIISLLKRIQVSISKGESRGAEEKKNRDESSENKPLTKAILDILEKPRINTEGDTSVKEEQPKRQVKITRPPSSFTKRTHIPSPLGPRGKLPVTESDTALEDRTEKEEKPQLIETCRAQRSCKKQRNQRILKVEEE